VRSDGLGCPQSTLQREHVTRLISGQAHSPATANGLRKILRALMGHAIAIGLRADDPTVGVKKIANKTDGHHSWAEEEIERYEARHPVGSKARLALCLLLYTGQRRGDAIRMGRQHIRDGILHITQEKTGAKLAIPVHRVLAAEIAAAGGGSLSFLTTEYGRPFVATGFSHKFRTWCDEAGLSHCSAHGLRKAAARRLAEAGATTHEIAAITGHASLKEVERYTRAVDQQRLAAAAMRKAEAGTSTVNLSARFDKTAENS